ncbi:MAG: DUF3052 domain-containing protein [Acidimicrobiales bacterium]
MAGYSGTPLVDKLGIRPGSRLALLSAPGDLALDLPPGVTVARQLRGHFDVVVLFTVQRAELQRRIDRIGEAIFPAGAAWIAFPKRAAKMATDMTDHAVRGVALPLGLVDTKVCAVDERWTGIKLVWRTERRKKSPHATGPGPQRAPGS